MPNPERSKQNQTKSSKTVTLSEKDVKDAARLLRLFSDPAAHGSAFSGLFPPIGESSTGLPDRQTLLSRARIVLNGRRARKSFFRRDLFGEPAWEIILALYVAEEMAGRLTISKLAEEVEAPLSTVIRWVKTLEEESLVVRVDHPTDRRTVFIRLLEKGRKALDTYLGQLPA